MRRHRTSALLPVLLLALVVAACGDDGDGATAPELRPLVGTWTATTWVVTNTVNPDDSVRLIDDGEGAELTLEIAPDGGATLTIRVLGTTQTTTGTARVEGEELVLQPSDAGEEPDRFVYTLAGDTLTLEGEIAFDFNQDLTPETATTRIVLVR